VLQQAVVIVACWLLASSIGYAQSDNWNAVTALAPGTRLRVELARGQTADGILKVVDDLQLTLERKVPAPRAAVRKVKRLGLPRTREFAKWGLLIGAVTGASLAYATVERSKGAWALLQSVGWGSIGAAIGATEGAQSPRLTMVYRAP
jgi:hypothetical protein